ncbi:MAG: serine/threonine-protein phosphatase [Caldilineaceae bacterium]|nr:serine/threonine-protein phosphatase [Caldilineaceae bacterium]
MTDQLEVQTAVEKIHKYASRESGDTVEVVERPRGGISIVVADGQRSGRSAKVISNIVVRKAISLLAEGVRDGAVARATHDYLHLQRGGKVSAELFIVSVDLVTRTLVVSRNARCPVLLRRGDEFIWLQEEADAIGIYRNTKPAISEMPLDAGLTLFIFTDGIWGAGGPGEQRINLEALLKQTDPENSAEATILAGAILQEAMRLDHGRPKDDATVVAVKVTAAGENDEVRRMSIRLPI